MNSSTTDSEKTAKSNGLSIDRAAFLLLRVKKAFKKKKASKNKDKSPVAGPTKSTVFKEKPPLLRSRTLPAIIVPGISILQAQIEARYAKGCKPRLSSPEPDVPDSLKLSVPSSRGSSTNSNTLYRLTSRFLNQRGSTSSTSSNNNNIYLTASNEKPRRLSWERRDVSLMCGRLPRSSSIDSVVEWGGDNSTSPTTLSPSASPSSSHSGPPASSRQTRVPSPLMMAPPKLLLLSPSTGRRIKFDTERPKTGMEFLVDGLALTSKTGGKKRIDKLNRINIHLHALFAAVEHGQIEKARTILESTDINVNSMNTDSLSPLDIAVLNNNRTMTKMLISFGAEEGGHYDDPEKLRETLSSLLNEAETRLEEMSTISPENETSDNGNSDKQKIIWERRVKSLKKMLLGFEQARPPDEPSLVGVDVTGTSTVTVRFQEPDFQENSICTKYKIQWAHCENFSLLEGEKEIKDVKKIEIHIHELTQGKRYYFRVYCGNLMGYGPARLSTPLSVIPSSWRDKESRKARYTGCVYALDDLFAQTKRARPETAAELRAIEDLPGDTPQLQRRGQKKSKTIKQLFTAASKFQKNLKRGVFLACLLYHEDKILVTNEDFLPVVEVDENYPSSINPDFHWLMKVACTWDDVKSLKQDMEKSNNSTAVQFRIKLLQAASQMQTALSIQDIGQLYPRPLRDSEGTLVICTVASVKSPKTVSGLNARWIPLSKLQRRCLPFINTTSVSAVSLIPSAVTSSINLPSTANTPESEQPPPINASDTLMSAIPEIVQYHIASGSKLQRGLYLGYLKLRSSVDLIQILVSNRAPNVLPHCKIRDNPHVCSEEWEWLKKLSYRHKIKIDGEHNDDSIDQTVDDDLNPTDQQRTFTRLVAATARRLLSYMEVTPEDTSAHRLYDAEVVEVSPEVSFLIVIPAAESVCAVPGTRDRDEPLFRRDDLLLLPLQSFEMIHLATYQRDLIARYSRLSSILETDTILAQHTHREAFSTAELQIAKDRLSKLQDLQTRVNKTWKGARWIMDLLTFARDRSNPGGVPIRALLPVTLGSPTNVPIIQPHAVNIQRVARQHLQPPSISTPNSAGSRGSWPPPPALLAPRGGEHMSRSDQQLYHTNMEDTHLPANNHHHHHHNHSNTSKNSALYPPISISSPGSNTSSSSPQGRLPPSRSDDQLHKSRRKSSVPTVSTSLLQHGHSQSDSTLPQGNGTPRRASSSASSASSLQGVKPQQPPPPPPPPPVSMHSSSADEDDSDSEQIQQIPNEAILQVYTAYETGLASGTSLKLHVTSRTTAREVVDLVVRQLNMAVVLKGKSGPVYGSEQLKSFCLVAVIGARERCLRDDFKPLALQNPWRKGRLYVRMKHDVLAAIEQSARFSAYL